MGGSGGIRPWRPRAARGVLVSRLAVPASAMALVGLVVLQPTTATVQSASPGAYFYVCNGTDPASPGNCPAGQSLSTFLAADPTHDFSSIQPAVDAAESWAHSATAANGGVAPDTFVLVAPATTRPTRPPSIRIQLGRPRPACSSPRTTCGSSAWTATP